jgi:hypothetical protein
MISGIIFQDFYSGIQSTFIDQVENYFNSNRDFNKCINSVTFGGLNTPIT